MITAGELAARLDLSLSEADAGLELTGLAPLGDAGPTELAFVADRKYLKDLEGTRAACVILRADWASQCPVPALCCEDPYLAYARATAIFDNRPAAAAGIHPQASVSDDAQLGVAVAIGPGACVEAGARLGDGVVIGAGAYIGHEARIGAGTRISPNVVIYHRVILGEACIVHACTAIGSDGFGYARGPAGWEKIRQLGTVRIGDRVDIGAGCTIDRGALGDTVIADGVIIDNQVHIAHNCEIGERTAIAGCVGMAGSTRIGADCSFAGQVGISGHVEICDNSHFMGQARVSGSVREPGTYASGSALEPLTSWMRNAVRSTQLDAMHKRIAVLERALKTLQDEAGEDS